MVIEHDAVFGCHTVTDLINVLGITFQQEVPGEQLSTAEHFMKVFRDVVRMEYLTLPFFVILNKELISRLVHVLFDIPVRDSQPISDIFLRIYYLI
jgi:hypothetical protein